MNTDIELLRAVAYNLEVTELAMRRAASQALASLTDVLEKDIVFTYDDADKVNKIAFAQAEYQAWLRLSDSLEDRLKPFEHEPVLVQELAARNYTLRIATRIIETTELPRGTGASDFYLEGNRGRLAAALMMLGLVADHTARPLQRTEKAS